MITISYKTITQQTFELELPDDATVLKAKEMLAGKNGETFAVELQKHIYNGKVLEDSQLLSGLNVDSKKFIAVMLSKKKVVPVAAPQQSVAASASASQPGTATAPTGAEARRVTSSTDAPPPPEVPAELLPTVAGIEAMGYPRDEVIRALKLAFGNAERAIEYLCNGVPPDVAAVAAAESIVVETDGGEEDGEGPDDGENSGSEVDDIEEDDGDDGTGAADQLPAEYARFQTDPNFQILATMIRSNPAMLAPVLQTLAVENPAFAELIRTNPQAFMQLINTTPMVGGVAAPQEQPVRIAVSQQDRDAIQRLTDMGFPEQLALEAYFACDKNEELAVNYILTHLDEFNGGR